MKFHCCNSVVSRNNWRVRSLKVKNTHEWMVNLLKSNHMLNNHLTYLHNNSMLPQPESTKNISSRYCSRVDLHLGQNLRNNEIPARTIHMSRPSLRSAIVAEHFTCGGRGVRFKMQPKVKIYCCRYFKFIVPSIVWEILSDEARSEMKSKSYVEHNENLFFVDVNRGWRS